MAKNLKLNIKNAQLAEALKRTQIKKVPTPKKQAEPILDEPSAPPVEKPPVPKAEEPVVAAPPPPPPVEAAPPKTPEAPPAPRVAPASAPRHPERPTPRYPDRPAPRYPERPVPHYQDRTAPRYPTSSRPPFRKEGYPQGPRPQTPYTPGGPRREGGYPPRREGYSPQGPRPSGPRPFGPRPMGPRPSGPGYPRRDSISPSSVPLPSKGVPGEARKSPGAKTDGPSGKAPFKEFREFKSAKRTTDNSSFNARDRKGLGQELDEQGWRRKRPSHKNRSFEQPEEIIRPKNLQIRLPITVKDLASEMKLKASQLIAKLFMKGVVLTLNDFLDDETTIQLLGHDFDCEITIDTSEEDRVRITDKTIKQEIQETAPDLLVLRPPVATFMGHVDHGKTSLIDTIRKTNMAAGESGAITQHIGAFKCHTPVGDLTILDTPGHEAFSAMRSRGADVTDIVVLVIAGDEGIRTQTLEAIQQAKAAQVPIIVAINKADKPNFNPENVYRQLADHELLPEAWGGTTITVNCSAITGAGIKELLEMLALQAEILELRANPDARARGTVIESEMHKGLGSVATILVQNGTLRIGDPIVFAQHYARVKTMQDEHGKNLTIAPPSTPIKITGLSGLPEAGSEFIVVANEKEARELAEKRSEGQRHTQLQLKRSGLDTLLQEKSGVSKKVLNLILRADVQGSVEAMKTSLQKIQSAKVEINFISTGVGEISESDIQLAAASKATILGFHTKIESHAETLIKSLKVPIKLHDIIYHAVDDVRELMLNLLDKIPQETDTGTAEVKAVFKSSQLGMIAGCGVTSGTIKRSHHMRVVRGDEVVWKGSISSLKRAQEDVKEVSKGMECGILLQNYNGVQVGDQLQAYEITYLTQEL